ncbi:MAG: hypothetical protein AB1414_08035 [bacterium]
MLALNKISFANKILYLANLILCIGIIIYFSLPKKELVISRKRGEIKLNAINLPPSKPYSYYSNLIGSRYLFVPLVEEEVKEKVVQQSLPNLPVISAPPPPPPQSPPPDIPLKIPLEKRVGNLRLIGVVFDESSGTAIIQDGNKAHQYFLKRGDYIQGVKIDEVFEDKVILKDGDEIVELRM